jgi:putative transcriptional regulator
VTGNGVALSKKRWLVAQVRIYHEKKTSERLTKMGIENYVPVQRKTHLWSDRRKQIDHIVIPMKIFVRVDAQEQKDVLMLSAVSRYMVLHGESAPAVIPDTQMEKFKFMLDYSEEAVNMSNAPLSPGEKVRVIKGPLRGLEGELVTLNGKTKIAVRLDMLGCASVDMPVGYIERVM